MKPFVTAVMAVIACAPAVLAQDVDPRGVFFHSYTGPSSAVEWVHIWEQPGDRRYEFSDIRGIAPFSGTITTSGDITWDTGAATGSGSFSDTDHATFGLVFQGSNYSSTIHRAPGTDADFITQIGSREDGDASIGGNWDIRVETLDARTGAILTSSDDTMTLDVSGDLLRMTHADGTYYQGVFETGTTAGFRVVAPIGLAPRFRTFTGSETSLAMNLLGDFRMTGEDSFEAVMLFQNRANPGQQFQTISRIVGSRVPTPGAAVLISVCGITAARRRRG